ncbi:MAG: hypothetical protein RLZZ15_1114 [Verrucomicrobiota bacterium]|jgi:NitT/TauT family transport system substrate-binding protein
MPLRRAALILFAAMIFAAGCARERAATAPTRPPGPRKITFQTDWLPQAEHGGFYQALAKGFYRDAGLAVEILPGGPGVGIKLKVANGDADFGLHRSDDVIVAASRGLPLVMVAAVFQHDPQALLVHEASPVRTLRDLDGRTVIASPGMAWIPYVQGRLKIKFSLTPNAYSLAPFLADPSAIQQCLVTSEPFFARQRGVRTRTIPIADAEFDCYHTIICRRELAQGDPETVRAFVAASLRGWRDYLELDPEPAHALILARNPAMSAELLRFARSELILRRLVIGDPEKEERVGHLSLARLGTQRDTLLYLKIIDRVLPINAVATTDFLPPPPKR